jgi:signal recognition particle subunit SRP19
MVSRDEDKYVIWPIYFDAAASRFQGRKVPKKHAVEKPTSEDIAKAAKSLGMNPVLEKNAVYPGTPYKKDGRVIVDKKGPKTKLLIQIANRL